MSKFLGFINTKPKIILHYPILTAFLFLGFYLGEQFLSLSNLSIIEMFVFWTIVLLISDNIIHTYIIKED
jgi:hypothetical protein